MQAEQPENRFSKGDRVRVNCGVFNGYESIVDIVDESNGRVSGPSGAAARLGVPRSTLESRIRSLKINKHRFKAEP